jgi:hypothetical protein
VVPRYGRQYDPVMDQRSFPDIWSPSQAHNYKAWVSRHKIHTDRDSSRQSIECSLQEPTQSTSTFVGKRFFT